MTTPRPAEAEEPSNPRAARTLLAEEVTSLPHPMAILDRAAPVPTTRLLGVLGLVLVAAASSIDLVWALAAGSARDRFVSSPRRIRRVGGAGGLILMALGAGVISTARRA